MTQPDAIKAVRDFLSKSGSCQSLKVRCDHVEGCGEELSLFIGPKEARTGRASRISEVDLIGCHELTRKVMLIVEVDFQASPTPKHVLSNLLPVLLADGYTPSYELLPYKFENTLVIFLTLIERKNGSQKQAQFRLIEKTIRDKFQLKGFGIADVRICFGSTEEEAFQDFKKVIDKHFGELSMDLNAEQSPVIRTQSPGHL
jgi:hypothetical protein